MTDVDDDHIEIKYRYNKYDCLARNYSWVNAHRNFDNGVEALTSLIAIALRNGWISIIHSASDSTGVMIEMIIIIFRIFCIFPYLFAGPLGRL